MVRLVAFLTIALVLSVVVALVVRDVRRIAATRPRSPRPGPRRRRGRRDRPAAGAAATATVEDRTRILRFLETRRGVEIFVEPRTPRDPLSAVLVADDGVWLRVPLGDGSFIRGIARARGIPVYDAARTGYPGRMRRDDGRPPPEGG